MGGFELVGGDDGKVWWGTQIVFFVAPAPSHSLQRATSGPPFGVTAFEAAPTRLCRLPLLIDCPVCEAVPAMPCRLPLLVLFQHSRNDFSAGCHFWSNFEIGRLSFFRSAPYLQLFDHLDRAGGFFYER